MVAGFISPPQRSQAGASPASLTRGWKAVRSTRWPQARQDTYRAVPCSSITLSALEPAAWCRPSTFWVITAPTLPMRSRLTTAWWAALGCETRNRLYMSVLRFQ